MRKISSENKPHYFSSSECTYLDCVQAAHKYDSVEELLASSSVLDESPPNVWLGFETA